MRMLLALLLLLLPLPAWGKGAAETGRYPNLFAQHLGVTEKAVDTKLDSYWTSMFGGDGLLEFMAMLHASGRFKAY